MGGEGRIMRNGRCRHQLSRWSHLPLIAVLGITGALAATVARPLMAFAAPATALAPASNGSGPTITEPNGRDATTTQTPTISGQGVPGQSIAVETDPAGQTVCTTTVASDGSFSCVPVSSLPRGPITLVAVTQTLLGLLNVTGPPTTVTIGASAAITSPAAGSTTANQTPTISGTGQSGDHVIVTVNGTQVCSATVGANGQFHCTPTVPLQAGPTTLGLTESDPDGSNTSTSPGVSVTIGQTPAPPPPPAPTTQTISQPTPGATQPTPGATQQVPGSPAAATARRLAPSAALPASSRSVMGSDPASVSAGSGGLASQPGVPVAIVTLLGGAGLLMLWRTWRQAHS